LLKNNILLIIIAYIGVIHDSTSQIPFSKVFDLNYHQQNSYTLIQIDSFFYITGNVLEMNVPDNERKTFIAKVDLQGNYISHILHEDNDLAYASSNNARDFIHIDNYLYVAEGASSNTPSERYTYVVKYDISANSSEFLYTISDNTVITFPTALAKNNAGQLAFLMTSNLPHGEVLLEILDPDEAYSVLNRFEYSSTENIFYPSELIINNDGYTIIGYHRTVANPDIIGLFAFKLDGELNLVKEKHYDNLGYYSIYLNGTKDISGDIIFLTSESKFDPSLPFPFSYSYRPLVTKIDSNLDIIWQKVIGHQDYRIYYHQHNSIIPSNEGNGYIISGLDYDLQNGVIAKVDNDGDSVWYREIESFDKEFMTTGDFFELIATSDDNYLAVGGQSTGTQHNDSIYNKIWLMKFDEDGHIVTQDTTSSTSVIMDYNVHIYPNPVSDMLYIENNDIGELSYQLYNESGQLVAERNNTAAFHTYLLDVSLLESGVYYLHAISNNNLRRVQKVVVVH